MTLATTSGKGASAMMEKRRWRIPPPSIQDGDSPGPEGLSVLGEIQGELGAVLWKSLRSVLLWAGTESAYRRKLFDPPAADRRQRGDYEHSLPIFIETLGRVGAADRPIVLGSLGRAAGGLNDVAALTSGQPAPSEHEGVRAGLLAGPDRRASGVGWTWQARDLIRAPPNPRLGRLTPTIGCGSAEEAARRIAEIGSRRAARAARSAER